MEIHLDAEALTDEAETIVVADVVKQQSKLVEDHRGKHIYTVVTLRPAEMIQGASLDGDFTIEVVGGTVDGITERVSNSPTFKVGETSVLFLKGKPLRMAVGRQGKRLLDQGKFVVDGFRITPNNFAASLKGFKAARGQGRSLESFLEEKGEKIRRNVLPRNEQVQSGEKVQTSGEPVSSGPKVLNGGQLPPGAEGSPKKKPFEE